MNQDLKPGQFWRDTVNTDVLKILEISEYVPGSEGAQLVNKLTGEVVHYARCACYPRAEYLMGIQEMRASRFGDERFHRVRGIKALWYRLKFRKP